MVTITTDVDLFLDDIWENITDEQFEKEAAARGYWLVPLNADDLLSTARRDPREALILIERELGHRFIGLLTE